ncbi:MAG: hypothetical protein ACLUGI_10920 [Subdoligranulum sp.]
METALLCTVCKCRTAQFEDALREILLADTPDANPKLDELAKYKLDEVFWKHCETELGFAVPAPNVDKLKISLFVTSLAHSVEGSSRTHGSRLPPPSPAVCWPLWTA